MPASHQGQKVLLEFEGVRQAATVYVNGTRVGLYENGVAPFGFDITNQIRFGAENVIAVKADNTKWRPEESTGMPFQWDTRDFNPTYGGLTRNVRMYVIPRTYFTLPLYTNLRTTGTYVYANAFDVAGAAATVNVESQVRNEQTTARTVTVSANVVQLGRHRARDHPGRDGHPRGRSDEHRQGCRSGSAASSSGRRGRRTCTRSRWSSPRTGPCSTPTRSPPGSGRPSSAAAPPAAGSTSTTGTSS